MTVAEFKTMFDALTPREKKQFVQNNKSIIKDVLFGSEECYSWELYPTSVFLNELKKRETADIVYVMEDTDAVRDWLEKELRD